MKSLRVDEALRSTDRGMEDRTQAASLSDCVKMALEAYFSDLGGHAPANLYQMVIQEVERPLLDTVMHQVQGNQTRAAQILGINRSTLRKKLAQHGLTD